MSLKYMQPGDPNGHCSLEGSGTSEERTDYLRGVAITYFFLGSIFGALSVILLLFLRKRYVLNKDESSYPATISDGNGEHFTQSPMRLPKRVNRISDATDSGEKLDPRKLSLRTRRRRRLSKSDDGRLFANNIRKFSLLNEFQHGLIEARGVGLEIVSIDPIMHKLLGWPVGSMPRGADGPALPRSVHELLPAEFRDAHRKFVAKAAAEGQLPSSLMHPLRNVQMVRLDGTPVHVDVCVGVITKDLPLDSDACMFYALVSERRGDPAPADAAPDAAPEPARVPESIASIAQALYGRNVGLSVARGVLPRPEDYAKVNPPLSQPSEPLEHGSRRRPSDPPLAVVLCQWARTASDPRAIGTVPARWMRPPPSAGLRRPPCVARGTTRT